MVTNPVLQKKQKKVAPKLQKRGALAEQGRKGFNLKRAQMTWHSIIITNAAVSG